MESRSTSLVLSTRVWTYGMHPSTQKNEGPAKTPRSRRNSCFGHSTFAHLPAGMFVGQDDTVFTPSRTEKITSAKTEAEVHANQRKQHACTAKSSRAKAGILKPLVVWKEPRTGSRKAHKRLQGRHQVGLAGFLAGLLRGHAPTEKGCSSEVAAVAWVRGAHPGACDD